jgi:competence protein ComGC
MADQQAKGSILLKIVIVLFLVGLIMVIIIPGDIWEAEEQAMEVCRANMLSIYEAHRYYHQVKNEYAPDMSNLILTIQNDSSLLRREQVVKYTVRLRNAMEAFLNSPINKDLYKISTNIKSIHDDIVQNERYFKSQDETIVAANVLQHSEELKMTLSAINGGVEFENYIKVVDYLDSLWQIRRDLSDYSLQTAARRSSNLASSLMLYLPNVSVDNLNRAWQPISTQISNFINLVNSIKRLKESTTVADRIADFQSKASAGVSDLNTTGASASDAQEKSDDLKQVYREFLGDFLITEYYAQYRLSDTDSMLLALNENNFLTPIDNLPYVVDLDDSINIRVEDPTLLETIKAKTMVHVEIANQLPFMPAFAEYGKTIDSLKTYYMDVKRAYRRNLDITIKTKELDDLLPRIKEVAAFSAYTSYKALVDRVPQSDSFSEIKDLSAEALIASGSFIQIYNDNFFGKLDTLHKELIGHLNEFESLVSETRRNPFSFQWAMDSFNTSLNAIKSPTGSEVGPKLQQIKTGLEEVYIFANEGESRTVKGVFSTQVVNHGKVFGRTAQKSWEEE